MLSKISHTILNLLKAHRNWYKTENVNGVVYKNEMPWLVLKVKNSDGKSGLLKVVWQWYI